MNDFSCLDDDFIKINKYLIDIAIGKYSWLNTYEDIVQEAHIWLCDAKIKFNPNRGAKWTTYARYYIEHKFMDYIRISKMAGRDPKTEGFDVVGLDCLLDSTLYKNIVDNNKIDDVILYDMALNCLSEGRNKEILILITLGFTYNEIHMRYKISRERVRQIYNEQIEIIKEKICDD
jgi:RNA polymerase sigma factor (sigma-70 family)